MGNSLLKRWENIKYDIDKGLHQDHTEKTTLQNEKMKDLETEKIIMKGKSTWIVGQEAETDVSTGKEVRIDPEKETNIIDTKNLKKDIQVVVIMEILIQIQS